MDQSTLAGDVHLLDGTLPLTREAVGGKAYSLNRMSALGLPVPPAFAIGVDVCPAYHEAGGRVPDPVWAGVLERLAELERRTGRRFGDAAAPLLLSVRSGAERSMPGMMDTVLNLGLTETLRDALAEQSGNREWADDTWTRFVRSYTDIVGSAPPADPSAPSSGPGSQSGRSPTGSGTGSPTWRAPRSPCRPWSSAT
mgnify:CR=1 FL=1